MSLLEVRDLRVEFDTFGGVVKAVRGVDLSVDEGRTLAIVGESGCGKSVTVQALMGLVPSPPGRVTSGSVRFRGRQLLGLPAREVDRVRGREIGMIFQDPMTSLDPTMTVGRQVAETLRHHERMGARAARRAAVELLERVRIPDARARVDEYPFQLSGGMRQRVMIAAAIACRPALLVADEPTTALDVTVQAGILALLRELQRERGMAIVLITHDLGVVAQMADDVAVMYGGLVVERGAAADVFYRPAHPYTLGLLAAKPHAREGRRERLAPIEGSPPDLFAPPAGCAYFARCPHAMRICGPRDPPLWDVGGGHASRCWLHHAGAAARAPAGLHRGAAMEGPA
jgi:oligopeptide transport system ATP-binding protein